MKAKQLAEQVRALAPPDVNPGQLDRITQDYIQEAGRESFYQTDAANIIERVGTMGRAHSLVPDSPSTRLTGKKHMAAISPWVESLRREIEELSGDITLPFRHYDDAVAWLRSTSPGEPSQEFVDADGRRRFENPVLVYPTPDGEEMEGLRFNALRAGRGSVRLCLKTQTDRIAEALGFPEADVVRHVLTGEDIFVPSLVVARRSYRTLPPVGDPISRTEVVVTVRNHELTPTILREINRYVRRTWGAERVKSLTSNDERLLAVVDSLGGAPEKPGRRIKFWETVRAELRSSYKKKYASWRGPYGAYNRLQTKLERFGD